MGIYTDKLNVTKNELDAYFATNEGLSDMDYMRNGETGEYDVPAIEWDGPYGRHWQRFGCEEDRQAALDRYDKRIAAWVVNYRTHIQERIAHEVRAKVAKRKAAAAKRAALTTFGGSFPQLEALKKKMRTA